MLKELKFYSPLFFFLPVLLKKRFDLSRFFAIMTKKALCL